MLATAIELPLTPMDFKVLAICKTILARGESPDGQAISRETGRSDTNYYMRSRNKLVKLGLLTFEGAPEPKPPRIPVPPVLLRQRNPAPESRPVLPDKDLRWMFINDFNRIQRVNRWARRVARRRALT